MFYAGGLAGVENIYTLLPVREKRITQEYA
jgi:hypothetical protein